MANYLQKATSPFSTLFYQLSYEEKWLTNGWLIVAYPSCKMQLLGHHSKVEFAFQERCNRTWHIGPSEFMSWLELLLQRKASLGIFFSVPFLNNFLILQFSSRPVNKHVVYNTCQGHHPEKRSCLSPGCHFRLKGCYTVPRCGLCGPRSVSKTRCWNAGEKNFRKLDTYPATVNPLTFGPNLL